MTVYQAKAFKLTVLDCSLKIQVRQMLTPEDESWLHLISPHLHSYEEILKDISNEIKKFYDNSQDRGLSTARTL